MAENRYPHRLPRKSCRLNGFLDVKNGFFNSHVHVQNMLRITIWLGFPEFKLIHLCILWFIGCMFVEACKPDSAVLSTKPEMAILECYLI